MKSMAISEEQKEEIRAKVDIADLISSYGYTLKRGGNDLWCCCPFHNEKTPSFKVDVSRGTYHCFGCGESGDVFSFVMKQEGLTFGDAIRKLASSVGIELKAAVSPIVKHRKRLYSLMAELAMDFNKMLKSIKCKDAEVAREYVKQRELDADTIDKFLIGYAPKDVNKILSWAGRHGYSYNDLSDAGIIKISDGTNRLPYFYFSNRLVFSIKDKNGQVVAFSGRQLIEDKKSGKYVNSPETIIFKKSKTFFAFDEARKNIVKAPHREAIVCEGQIDCIRLHSNGFNTAIAPLGTAFTEDHAIMLHKVADTALLCFDDDGAGHKATIKAAQLLLAEGMPIRVLALPDGDDPDSYIRKHGKEGFSTFLNNNAESIVQFQIRAARASESNPDEANAVIRTTKAVLETIAKCKDVIQRDILLKEASKRLGIPLSTLQTDIVKEVRIAETASSMDAERLIEPIVAGNASDVNNPPSIADGALINFLMMKKDDKNLISCIMKLIPLDVIGSPTTKKIVGGILSNNQVALREAVEDLSTDEYRNLITIMASQEPSDFSSIQDKNLALYFARQLWQDYFARLLKLYANDERKSTVISNAIKTLNYSTTKGVVRLIQSFPLDTFKR